MGRSVKIIKNGFIGLLFLALLAVAQTGYTAHNEPREIPDNASCGKCGMHPAKFPQWQTQIIFTDGTMTPFDGGKCMFGYIFNMEKYDKTHKSNEIAAIYVRDFTSGKWINGKDADYVVGSKVMGPMGKELIPFGDHTAAMTFQKENGGTMKKFADINMDTLQPLMGDMKNMGHTDMKKSSGMKM